MENENLEEGRGKKGQARQAGRTQDDEWGAKDRLKKSFRNYADTRKKKTAHLDENGPSSETDPVEQINELSKKTLKSYIKKGEKNYDKQWAKSDKEEDKAMSTDGDKYPDKQKRHHDASVKFANKANSRYKQGKLAKSKLDPTSGYTKVKANESYVDALTEEGLQAIEIGINEYFLTLGEEVDQETFDAMVEDIAANLVTDLSEAEEVGSVLEFNNKETKKSKTDIVESVVNKYATDVEHVEISEEDHIIDTLSKHIHEKQIGKVLDLYDSLDEENREELLDLIETKEGINEVINFIIEDAKTSEEE